MKSTIIYNLQFGRRFGLRLFCTFAVMKALIIYGSQYGSTKRYAERLSETTGIEAVDYNDDD